MVATDGQKSATPGHIAPANTRHEVESAASCTSFSLKRKPRKLKKPRKKQRSKVNSKKLQFEKKMAMNMWAQHRDTFLEILGDHLHKKVSESTNPDLFWNNFHFDLCKACNVEYAISSQSDAKDYARFLVYLNRDFKSNREESTTYSVEFKQKLSLMLTCPLDFPSSPPQSYNSAYFYDPSSFVDASDSSASKKDLRLQLENVFVEFITKKRMKITDVPKLEAVLGATDLTISIFLRLGKRTQLAQIAEILSK